MPRSGERKPDKTPARALGSLIRDGRRAKKLSQRQLAAELPMSQTQLSRIELGDQPPPSDEVLLRIAGVLELDPRELLRVAGRQAAGATFETVVLDRLDRLTATIGELGEAIRRVEQTLSRSHRDRP